MARIQESNVFRLLLTFLVFLYLVFDRDLAIAYIIIIIADYIFWKEDSFVSFPMERITANRTKSILFTVAAYAGFLFITSVVFSLFGATKQYANVGSVIELMGTTTPILKGSKVLTFIGWGFVVAIIETRFFFGRLMEFLASYAKGFIGHEINIKRMTGETWVLLFIIASLFALFHLTSKNAENIPMLVTFLFGIISGWMVIRFQELKQATLFHILANSVAVAGIIGILSILAQAA